MTLGEKICSLRTAQGLSQSDLAEVLEVSRQSVSKWETDASVPDLDRLVSMSRLFHVSLDELVLGETREEPAKEVEEEATTPQNAAPVVLPASHRHIQTAVILFCTAGVVALLGLLLAGVFGLLLAIPFLLCGCITLISWRHPGLWCAWTMLGLVMLFLQCGTGIRWSIVFLTFQYEPSWNYTRLLVGWGFVLISLGLLLGTARQLRKESWSRRIPEKAVVIGCLICIVAGKLVERLYWVDLIRELQHHWNFLPQQFLMIGTDAMHLLLLTVLAVSFSRWLYRQRIKKNL